MSENSLRALLRLALSSPRACRVLARGDARANIQSESALRHALTASRLTHIEIDRLAAAIPGDDSPLTEAEIDAACETIAMQATY